MRAPTLNVAAPGWKLLAPIVLACAALPAPGLPLQLALCVPLIAMFGVPHGATDWKLAGLLLRGRYGPAWPLVFATLYGVLMALVGCAAAMAPQAAMVAFLVIAVWHFGAEDAAALGLRAGAPEIIICGALPVLAPAVFWPSDYTAVLHSLGVVPADAAFVVRALGPAVMSGWAVAFAVALWRNPVACRGLAADAAALLALQCVAPPLVSFAAYFCLLHGPRYMRALPQSVRGWQTGAVTAAAIAMIGLAAFAAARHVHADIAWASTNGLFWGLAALTLPHVVLSLIAAHIFNDLDRVMPVSAVRA
jgi:Brp/Blh family beta-carotene 15,15'-monooxygenase